MSDHYFIEKIAYGKIAEERKTAARYWLAVRADKARREAQGTAEPPLAGLLWALACTFGFGRPMQAARPCGGTHSDLMDRRLGPCCTRERPHGPPGAR